MGYKTFVSMNVAVISTGQAGESIAEELALAGHEVLLGCINEKAFANKHLLDLYDNIHIYSITEAAAAADLIIIATTREQLREVAYWLDDVRHKVIIDATDTSAVPEPGAEYIHTVNAIKAITGAKHVVKSYNCTSYEPVLKSFFKGEHISMLIAGDSKKAKELTKILAGDMGFDNCHDFGSGKTIQLLDEMVQNWKKHAIREKMMVPTKINKDI
jgi:predicted dinucleotide-binding enzyme